MELLAAVREALGDPAVTFTAPPRRLLGGGCSTVWAVRLAGFDGELVARVGGDGFGVQPVAAAAGLAPEVLVATPTLTLERRLPGRSYLRGVRPDQFLRDLPKVVARWPSVLADVAARLHAVPVPDGGGLPSGDRHRQRVEAALPDSPAVAWLRANDPGPPPRPVLVHGDLWPANVLFDGGRLSGLVDWGRSGVGDPALDVGFASAAFALLPAPSRIPLAGVLHPLGTWTSRRIGTDDPERVRWYEVLRCLLDLVDAPGTPWEHGTDALRALVRRRTGVDA